jgi:hypothetical protein
MPQPPSSSSSSSSLPNNKKRKHPSIEQVVQNERKKIKIKVETAIESIQEDLEDAQETLGYEVLAHNNKMTQIDALKQQIKDLQHQVEALNK